MFKMLLSELSSRWSIVLNWEKKYSGFQRIFAALEIFCFPVSFFTLLLLLIQVILQLCFHISFPDWFVDYAQPVLLSGAVGYLTNWLAIMMLFRPYVRKKWLWVWPQGMVPQNKPAIARAMGNEVGNGLLNVEKIIVELSGKLHDYLMRPDVISRLKEKFRLFLLEHRKSIVDFLVPHVKSSLYSTLDKFLTADNMRKLYDRVVEPMMRNPEHRKAVSAFITGFGSRNLEKIVDVIRSRMQAHLEDKLSNIPLVGIWSDKITGIVMDFFADRTAMERMIDNWLKGPDTEKMILDLMDGLRIKARTWIDGPEAQRKLDEFSDQFGGNLKEMIGDYLQNSLPQLVGEAVNSEALWNWIEKTLLPRMVDGIYAYVGKNKDMLLKNLNLAERIESAINAQDVRKFHNMINNIAARHLGAIQVLGFVLGIVIGAVQLMQTVLLAK